MSKQKTTTFLVQTYEKEDLDYNLQYDGAYCKNLKIFKPLFTR